MYSSTAYPRIYTILRRRRSLSRSVFPLCTRRARTTYVKGGAIRSLSREIRDRNGCSGKCVLFGWCSGNTSLAFNAGYQERLKLEGDAAGAALLLG
eukprot:9495121-Pyramimonas_sp.AAC.1